MKYNLTMIIFIFIFVIVTQNFIPSIIAHSNPSTTTSSLFPSHIAHRLRTDYNTIESASHDFGNKIGKQKAPIAVFNPSTPRDIVELIKFTYEHDTPLFNIAARGQGHSVDGQAMAHNGVVVNMTSLKTRGYNDDGPMFVNDEFGGTFYYVDVGGEQLWIDVLSLTLEHGLAPVSWTDYLYLTVGGTLSNAGVSGQTFRYGPQIRNVLELDVVTGKGEFLTCSTHINSDLFNGVLGGLGQFGIITRARILLQKAPKRVKWVRLFYSDFAAFTRDQERLISVNGNHALNFLEGSVLLNNGSPNNWRSSFFSDTDYPKLRSLLKNNDIIYYLEIVKYFDDNTRDIVNKEVEEVLTKLSFIPGFKFEKDETFVGFLNRVRSGELVLRSKGEWEVPHPWLNMFIPKSKIFDFNNGVLNDIVLRRNITTGPVLLYPMNRNKWDDKMSAVIPEEEVFYTVGFLHSSGFDNWEAYDDQNKAIIQFCENSGIQIKQYLPHYLNQQDWIKHFGPKWNIFRDRKSRYDPKMLLSPGQRIFNI